MEEYFFYTDFMHMYVTIRKTIIKARKYFMNTFPFAEIGAPLVAWYNKNARKLPWRETTDPYKIWVSEIMLQQTRVVAVIPYFERFMQAAPTVQHLAALPEEQLMKLWEGLGYYSRARNLQKAAKMVVEDFDGKLPATAEELQTLPGIGPYTAGAVSSIAFGLPAPAVDGNVLRVMTRLTANNMDIADNKNKKIVGDWLLSSFPENNTSAFTQGLMELGATICLPNAAPLCEACPLSAYCRAYKAGTQLEYPVKTAKKGRRVEQYTVFLMIADNKVAIQKRSAKGLLASLWQFPIQQGHLLQSDALAFLKEAGVDVLQIKPLLSAKHIFTHIEWHMQGYYVKAEQAHLPGFVFATKEELDTIYSIPSAFSAYKKIIPDFIK